MPYANALTGDANEEPNKSTKEELKEFLVRTLNFSRPKKWSPKANAPYYRELYAKVAKKIIDDLFEDPSKPFIYYYKNEVLSRRTIAVRFNQGKMYLIDKMDTEDKHYAKIAQFIHTYPKPGVGLYITFRKDIMEDSDNIENLTHLLPSRISENDINETTWLNDMEAFLLDESTKKFERHRLNITKPIKEQIDERLGGLESIAYNVDESSIVIVKI